MNITLANLEQATEQQVADHIARHLLTQKRKATNLAGDTCVYHAPDGKKCAAGCLIADNEYRGVFEFYAWSDLVRGGVAPRKHLRLIESFQRIHDDEDANDWPSEIKTLFRSEGLDPACIREFEQ